MNNQLESSGFTSEGHEPFPSLYSDNQQVGQFTEWTTEALVDRVRVYQDFIVNSHLPSHQSVARRIIDHAAYELNFRFGCTDER